MAISIHARFTCKHVAALLAFIVVHVKGVEIYENSFISPNSAQLSQFERQPQHSSRTSAPNEIKATLSLSSLSETEGTSSYIKTKRSAEPILSKTSGIDSLLLYKNVEESMDSNDVELSAGIAHYIQPSRTRKNPESSRALPGEGRGAPQARSLSLQEPQEITPTATAKTTATATSILPVRGRQANPDIQDIITGIVKLLNGNVNVQANTAPAMGRPLRPLSTRINNRGPPRITDVPALPPDFDVPAPPLPPPPLGQKPPPPVAGTRLPTPYPFDMPPQNTSPVRPLAPMHDQKRPALFYRPVTIPPWNSRPRKPPRRPHPPIPPYKPLPSIDTVSLTSEMPDHDILTLDLGSHLEPSDEEPTINETSQEGKIQSNVTSEESADVTTSTIIDDEITDFEKNKEKSSVKKNKYTTTSTTSNNNITNITNEQKIVSTTASTTIKDIIMNSTQFSIESTKIEQQQSPQTTTSNISTYSPTEVDKTTMTPTTSSTTSAIIPTSSNTTLVENNTNSHVTGEASPILESSIQEVLQTLREELLASTSSTNSPTEQLPSSKTVEIQTSILQMLSQNQSHQEQSIPYYSYRPRPGIVLDDTEYKPGGGGHRQPIVTRPPIGAIGDIFDITVSAIQGPSGGSGGQGKPYVIPVDIENVHGPGSDVITSPVGDEGFVSIDGKRTYLNLFGDGPAATTKTAPVLKPSAPSNNQVTGTGFAVVDDVKAKPSVGAVKPTTQRRPLYGRPRPSQPPVRIDTCIVGDDSTCDASQHEICRTEVGVSACHCRPGHARRKHRDPCRKIVSVLVSLRVDRLYERRVVWAHELADKNSDSYQQLSYESERALESAMSMTPFSDEFLGARVNSIYRGERSAGQAGVFVNMTLQLDENADTSRATVKGDIQRHLLGVIQRRSNNVGNSALWVDSPPGSVSNLQDLDECSSPELHDCHVLAKCINIFGSFKCECGEGYRDPWADSKHRAGRQCEQCSSQHCNNRGECKYQNGQEVCVCSGNYYGNQCELDGEVLGVAIGASVAAVVIIGLTLVFLVMWSRRWSREQKAAVGSPVFGYMATASNTVKTPVVGAPPYQLTLEDRLRWAQIADVMAQANHYAPEPVTGPTRPSSAMFGYPSLGTLQRSMHGTLPPVPLPRLNLHAQMAGRAASIHGMRPLDNSSSSEEEDKADLLGRNFQVPRPKSRSNASIANQSGIYYDVDYDQNEIYKQAGGIPLSTYSIGRPPYYRN